MNPEFRQTLNTLSHNFESANQAAQENIYTFTQLYIDPCLGGFKSCLQDCTAPCFPSREDSLRRRRARGQSRGRAETFFDFYDDWDEDETTNSGMAWGNDELDSLLAGRGSQSQRQPQRQRAMSYGSRGRAKGGIISPEIEQDPTIIPGSSYLGFLESLPWRLGQRVLRYKPSAANLQENPGGLRMADAESQPLLEEDDDDPAVQTRGHTRQRSDTQNSRSTTNSLSSRGDLILSEEEDDALEIDEEFAITLGRRVTNTGASSEDHSSGKTGSSGKRPGASRRTTGTTSSRSKKSDKSRRSASQKSIASQPISPSVEDVDAPSMQELRQEEAQAKSTEELEIAQKREAAQRLADSRGLSSPSPKEPTAEIKPNSEPDTEPFPSMVEVRSPRPMSPEPTHDRSQSRQDESLPAEPPLEDNPEQHPP